MNIIFVIIVAFIGNDIAESSPEHLSSSKNKIEGDPASVDFRQLLPYDVNSNAIIGDMSHWNQRPPRRKIRPSRARSRMDNKDITSNDRHESSVGHLNLSKNNNEGDPASVDFPKLSYDVNSNALIGDMGHWNQRPPKRPRKARKPRSYMDNKDITSDDRYESLPEHLSSSKNNNKGDPAFVDFPKLSYDVNSNALIGNMGHRNHRLPKKPKRPRRARFYMDNKDITSDDRSESSPEHLSSSKNNNKVDPVSVKCPKLSYDVNSNAIIGDLGHWNPRPPKRPKRPRRARSHMENKDITSDDRYESSPEQLSPSQQYDNHKIGTTMNIGDIMGDGSRKRPTRPRRPRRPRKPRKPRKPLILISRKDNKDFTSDDRYGENFGDLP